MKVKFTNQKTKVNSKNPASPLKGHRFHLPLFIPGDTGIKQLYGKRTKFLGRHIQFNLYLSGFFPYHCCIIIQPGGQVTVTGIQETVRKVM